MGELVEWAGVRFTPMFHHDGRFFRCPGLYAFVHRGAGDWRTLLYVGEADLVSAAIQSEPMWTQALRLGFNELNLNIDAHERIDRLLLKGHIIKRCAPILNLVGAETEEPDARPMSLWRRQGA